MRTCGIPDRDARALDQLVESELLDMLGLGPLPAKASQRREGTSRTFLPLRDGGLGFQSVRLVAPAALAASWHASLPSLLEHLNLESPAQLESRSPVAHRLLPALTLQIQEAVGDHTVALGDPGVEISQNKLALASLVAASNLIREAAGHDLTSSAVLRSTCGPGAGTWTQTPSHPCHRMLDVQFAAALRVRLHLDVPTMAGTCQHRRPDASVCGAMLDSKGVQVRSCIVGGWLVRRHNAGVRVLSDWATEECGCTAFKEQALPCASEVHRESRTALIIHSPQVAGAMYVDFAVVPALSQEALAKGSALKEGVAATLAAKRKVDKYPGCVVFPFPVEDHGRFGEASATLAKLIAPVEPERRSKAISTLYQSLGAVLQRAGAEPMIAAAR